MNSRISFYVLVIALLTLLSWAGYKLFYSNDAERMAKSLSTPTKEDYQKRRDGASSGGNVWSNESLRKSFDSTAMQDLKGTALIENNIKMLSDLYNRGEDDELLPKALDLFEKNPDVKEYAAFLGDYYYNEGNWTEAEKYVKRLTELDPNNHFAKTTYSEVLAIQGRYDESLDTLKGVLAKDPKNLQALYGISSAFDMKGQPEHGHRYLEDVVKNDPSNGNAAAVLADSYFSQGRSTEGHRILDEGIKNDPNNAAPLIRKAEMRASEGNPKEGLTLLDTAYSKESTAEGKFIILKKMVNLSSQDNNLSKAEEALALMSQMKPNSLEVREAQRQIASLKEAGQPKTK